MANVFVSAYPAVPWTAISDKLEPKNNLSTSDARTLAAVATQSQVSQFLSTFAAGLAVGLPSRSSSNTTTIAADGTSTITGTRKLDPGVVSSTTGASGIALTDANLAPDLSKGPFAYGVDASTQLTVGTSVYQLAQILDNQISKSIAPKGYQAHLLTFQVNLQPKRRNLAYDAYLNLTLMPADWHQMLSLSEKVSADSAALPPIIVYPLVISDAMESSSVGRSVEVIRQAALALSGVVSNVGVGASSSGSSDSLQDILGSDRNSLVTVGRMSDHTLRIRLGAQQQGSRPLALVPRTHNISVVVFTKSGDKPEDFIERLSVITQTSFVNVNTGKEVPAARNTDKGREKLATQVTDVLHSYDYQFRADCTVDSQKLLPLDLLRAVDRGDFSPLEHCLQLDHLPVLRTFASVSPAASSASSPTKEPTAVEIVRLRRVAAELMSVQVDSRFSKVMVQLTEKTDREVRAPYPGQLALLGDDKSSSKVVLRGGANLDAKKLSARLQLIHLGKHIELLPTAVDVDADGRTVTLSFPSLVTNKLITRPNADPKKPDVDEDTSSMVVCLEQEGSQQAFESVRAKGYAVALVKPKAETTPNPASSGTVVLVPDSTGTAKLAVTLGAWDSKKQGALALRVTGADVRSIDPATALDPAKRAYAVSAPGTVTLTLGNLSSTQTVQIFTLADKEAVGAPITLSVEGKSPPSK